MKKFKNNKRKFLLVLCSVIVLVIGGVYVMTGLFKPSIRNQHLNKYQYSSGGGMDGGFHVESVTRYDSGHAIVMIKQAQWYYQDPVVEEYLVDDAILDEIETVVRKYRMNRWDNKKFTNMFVCDGASYSYSFSFDESYIHFSSQIYPVKYSKKLRQIDEIIKNNTCEKIVFDAEDLLYISSAGLRIMLKIKKAVDDFSIINASLDVYDIFQMTGFTEIIDVAKAMRKLSVDGCPVIGSGAKGLVYRYNSDTIVKVYKSLDCLDAIKNERELARKAFVLGIPTAISYDIVKVGDKYGSVFELLDANSFTQLIVKDTSKIDYYVEEYTNLLKSIHPVSRNAL